MLSTAPPTSTSPPPPLEPPYRGYIETTYDALLVFEAARRGIIPRVTRRLMDRERGMVQSGSVFVFDEHESGIKRWTDGLVWSPSRILGNFLVYRETDRRPGNPSLTSTHNPSAASSSRANPNSQSPSHSSPSSGGQPTRPNTGLTTPPNEPPPLGGGQLARPRSASEGGGAMDRNRERQLVGSLTTSYRFKERGLVKKTMSVQVNGFAQHLISYYTIEDVLEGRLRTPSSTPEIAALEVSQEYLQRQNFRFPLMMEVGPDGIARYRGEAEDLGSPTTPLSGMSMQPFPHSAHSDYHDPPPYSPHHTTPPHGQLAGMRMDASASNARQRSTTVPMPIAIPSSMPHPGYMPPSGGPAYYEPHSAPNMHHIPPPLVRQASTGSAPGAMRPSSSSRRYDPYTPSSGGRTGHAMFQAQQQQSQNHRRQSQTIPNYPQHSSHHQDLYSPPALPHGSYPPDIKPTIGHTAPHSAYQSYQPPPTAPSTFADFYGGHAPTPSAVLAPPPGQQMQSPMVTSSNVYTTTPDGAGNFQSWASAPNGTAPAQGGSLASSTSSTHSHNAVAPRMAHVDSDMGRDGTDGWNDGIVHGGWEAQGAGEPRWEGQGVA